MKGDRTKSIPLKCREELNIPWAARNTNKWALDQTKPKFSLDAKLRVWVDDQIGASWFWLNIRSFKVR